MKKGLLIISFIFIIAISSVLASSYENQSSIIFQARKEGYSIYRIPNIGFQLLLNLTMSF